MLWRRRARIGRACNEQRNGRTGPKTKAVSIIAYIMRAAAQSAQRERRGRRGRVWYSGRMGHVVIFID